MRLKIIFIIFLISSIILSVAIGIKYNNIREQLVNLPLTILKITQNINVRSVNKKRTSLSLDNSLSQVYEQLEIPSNAIKRAFSPNDSLLKISIEVPRGKPMELVIWKFSNAIKESQYTIIQSTYIAEKNVCTINAQSNSIKVPQLQLIIKRGTTFNSKTASIAILVEDFKFSADKTSTDFLSFSEPLSVSMVGEKKLSTWSAQIANEYKKEILVLLPMEPLSKLVSHYQSSAIMIHYSDTKIRSIINKATQSLPEFAGFCNLNGSRVLEDSRVMNIICQEVSRLNSYLIISNESRKSVALTIANDNEIPFRQIDHSFNTSQSEATLLDSLRHCALLAQKRGSLLVRGRFSPSFIKALNNCLPIFHHNGVQFVYVSDLIKNPSKNNVPDKSD